MKTRVWSSFGSASTTFVDWDEEPNLAALSTAKSQLDAGSPAGMRALEWLAEQGSVAAMLYIAGHWHRAEPPVLEKASMWYAKAAERGNTYAAHCLGVTLQALERYTKAKEFFESNAEIGFAPSVYRLGLMYKAGYGVEKDLKKAEQLFLSASEAGNIWAKKQIAHIYFSRKPWLRNKLYGTLILVSTTLFVFTFVFRPGDNLYDDDRMLF